LIDKPAISATVIIFIRLPGHKFYELTNWPHISDCILCWPFGQYSPVMIYVMFVIVVVCWLINSLK